MREAITEKRLHESSLSLIRAVSAVTDELKAEGLTLTLRQLYYEAVRRGLIQNKPTQYKRLGNVVTEARIAGHLDWDAIADPMRNLESQTTFRNAAQYVAAMANQYNESLWADQPYYAEVWIEKDAIASVVERACLQYRVPYFVCRGYVSQQCLYDAGKRFSHHISQGKIVRVFYLGDRDEFGGDLARDIEDRIDFFTRAGRPQFDPIAVRAEQITHLRLAPDPSNPSDFEIEALPPKELLCLIVSSIDSIVDRAKFIAAYQREQQSRHEIALVAKHYKAVIDVIDQEP